MEHELNIAEYICLGPRSPGLYANSLGDGLWAKGRAIAGAVDQAAGQVLAQGGGDVIGIFPEDMAAPPLRPTT